VSGRRANGSPSALEDPSHPAATYKLPIASRLIPDRKLIGKFKGCELGKEASADPYLRHEIENFNSNGIDRDAAMILLVFDANFAQIVVRHQLPKGRGWFQRRWTRHTSDQCIEGLKGSRFQKRRPTQLIDINRSQYAF
jgi:hypothetical protein